MGSYNLPLPSAENSKSGISITSASSLSSKSNRAAKRASSNAATSNHYDHVAQGATGMDGRHKRVWKACEHCRMKKTKCDGEFPCKRCKDNSLVCAPGLRKKMEYKQLPKGYAEVLENTQFALVSTVHKLYSMVRNNQQWELGEPELNDRGQPIIHNIAQKLGCIRPNSDIVHSVFPKDKAGKDELARQLEQQQGNEFHGVKENDESPVYTTDRASSSELDHSDIEQVYRKTAFGSSNGVTLLPQRFTGTNEFEFGSAPDMDVGLFASQSSPVASFPAWAMPKTTPNDMTVHFLQQTVALQNMDMLNQGMAESDFGIMKPHIMSCQNPNMIMGMGDPIIYDGYDGESMRL